MKGRVKTSGTVVRKYSWHGSHLHLCHCWCIMLWATIELRNIDLIRNTFLESTRLTSSSRSVVRFLGANLDVARHSIKDVGIGHTTLDVLAYLHTKAASKGTLSPTASSCKTDTVHDSFVLASSIWWNRASNSKRFSIRTYSLSFSSPFILIWSTMRNKINFIYYKTIYKLYIFEIS